MFAPKINNASSKSKSSLFGANDTEFIQPKLNIGQPGDKYEVEADAMADKVVSKSNDQAASSFFQSSPTIQKQPEEEIQKVAEETIQEKPLVEAISPLIQQQTDDDEIQGKCTECKQEDAIQTKPGNQQSGSSSIENQLHSSKGGGSSMSATTKSSMESGFGADFSNVRIHTDSSAVQMNKNLGAQAFANGNDIYFNEGKYNPESTSGKHLLAHELTHTIQQGGSTGMAQNKIQMLPDWVSSAAGWVSDTSSSAASSVANGAAWAGGQVADGAQWTGGQVMSGAGWVGNQISAAAGWVMDSINEAIESGTDFLNEKWDRIQDFGSTAFDDIKNGFGNLASFITSPMSMMMSSLSDMNADLLEGAWSLLKAGGDALWAGINSVVQGVLSAGEAIWQTVSGSMDGFFDTISGLFNNTAFNLLPDSIKSGIRASFNRLRALWTTVSSFWTDLWGRLSSFAEGIVMAVQTFIENVINYGIGKVVSMVRELKEVYDYITTVFADPIATIAPFVEGIAAMINEQGPSKSKDIGNKLTLENYTGGTAQSADNGVVQRSTLDGEERRTASLAEVVDGVFYYLSDAWANLDILDMLWQTFKNMFWPPATICAIFEQFSQLWNDDWATAINNLYIPRNIFEDPLGSLHDIWSNYLILLDFPFALWRTINNVIGLLMGYVTIIVVLVEGVVGAIAGSAAGGVGAIPGFFAGASVGLATMAPIGIALMTSFIGAEGSTVGINLVRLFTANQVCEKRQIDIKTSVSSYVTMSIASILHILMALLAQLLSMISSFLKGGVKVTPTQKPVTEPVRQPVQPAPSKPVPQPATPAPQPALPPNVIPFPARPQPAIPTPQPAVPGRIPIAAKLEVGVGGTAVAQLASEEDQGVGKQTEDQKNGEGGLYFSQITNTKTGVVQTSRSDQLDPDACNEDDDCESIMVPGYAPQDNISGEHARRNGGVSNGLAKKVTSIREISGYKELENYKGNNIAGFIYEVYENETAYRNSEPIQIATIVRSNDDIHSEERIVSELLVIKRNFPRGYIIRVDQIATERSACSTCYGIIRGNPTLTGNKIYTQGSGIYYIVRYTSRNWKQNATGLRAAYCGSTTE